MTRFQDKSFSVHLAGDQSYRDNWDRIFGKKEPDQNCNTLPNGDCIGVDCMHSVHPGTFPGISAEAQAVVSEMMAESMPKATTKRLLARPETQSKEPEPPKEPEPTCKECNDTGRVWASDEQHGHAIRIRCNCQR